MPTFENVEVIGPNAEVNGGRASHESADSAARDIPDTAPIAQSRPDWLKSNRRLAIFGAFAVGVFLGALARS